MTKPRILYFDIETAPNLAYVWGQFDQNVIDHAREWTMLSVAWHWEGDDTASGNPRVHALSNFHDFGETTDDTELSKALWALFDEADIIIAHNGDKFDIRKANARFVQLGLGAPSPFRSIDTRKVAKRYFAFNSNSLNNLGQHLGLGEKVQHPGWEMWEGCIAGEKQWWDHMVKYNKQDIVLLRNVYLALRPFISNHPNRANYDPQAVCPTCGAGVDKAHRRGKYHNQTTTYDRWHCQECGSYFRSRVREPEEFTPATTAVTRR